MELLDAVRDTDVEKVKNLIESRTCNVNYRDGNSRTCLMWAVRSGSMELVTILLEGGVHIDAKDIKGRTALTWAAECGRTDMVHTLLNNGAEFRTPNDLGPTALSWSAWRGHVDVVRILLQFGVDKNAQDNYGCSPLINACLNSKLAVIEELLHQKADPNIADDFARCPIGIAVERGKYEIAKLLCKAGANLQVFLPPVSLGATKRSIMYQDADDAGRRQTNTAPVSWSWYDPTAARVSPFESTATATDAP